jgi:hypothetical protein
LAFEDGLLQERTSDYFAQDTQGNVWYFGEDVTNFHYDEDGNLIGTDSASAWRAGVNGALPGFIMPANPFDGFNYYQEFAPLDGALDQGRIVSVSQQVSVPVGSFSNRRTGAGNYGAGPGGQRVQVLRAGHRVGACRRGLG